MRNPVPRLESAADIAQRAADVLSDKQASNIVLLDLKQVANFTDFFVIATGENERHMKALVKSLDEALPEAGVEPLHVEGSSDSGWVLVDYGPVLVHVFDPQHRAYYNLEGLWGRAAPVVHFQ